MNYLEEIKPYRQYIKLYLEGKGSPNQKIKDEMALIYDELRFTEAVTIYGRKKSRFDIPCVDMGCTQCITRMMTDLTNWIRIKEKEQPKKKVVDFKGVPDKKPSEMIEEEFHELTEVVDEMSWGEFKTYCREQGLKVKGKTKVALLEELKLI
jgi:hypothetical protein